jgi:hypothetical protein
MGTPPTENLEYMYHRADIQFWAHCDLKWRSDGLLKKSKVHCDLKWGSDGHLKKVKTDNGRQVIAKLKLLLDLTLIISSYNLLRNNKQFNYNTNFHNTNKNLFLKYLATKTIESKINYPFIVLHEILVATT